MYGRLLAEDATRSLSAFIRQAWHVHHGDRPLTWNWHIDAIAEHLEAVSRGEIRRLVINVPPGFMKSLIVSVYWPAWEWVQRPGLQYIYAAGARDVALRDARRCHELVDSPWYQCTFVPDWTFDGSQDAKGYYVNTAGGARRSLSTGQKITGFRGDRLAIDDPLDAADAYSDKAALRGHVEWIWKVLLDRRNDPHTPVVMIMQRLHESDAAGEAIRDGWDYLVLPNEYDGERSKTTIDWQDPRSDQGELLFPERIDAEETARLKRDPHDYARKYQQSPAPAAGAIFKEQFFRFWEAGNLPEFEYMIASWDCAGFKRTRDSDYVVGQVWGVSMARKYLLEQVRARMSLPEVIEAVRDQSERWQGLRTVLVEAKATGPHVIQALEHEVAGIQGWDPQGTSKEERYHAITPQFTAGQIYFPPPDLYPWVREYLLPELLAVPAASRDDQADAMAQAILWIKDHGFVMPWIFTLGDG